MPEVWIRELGLALIRRSHTGVLAAATAEDSVASTP